MDNLVDVVASWLGHDASFWLIWTNLKTCDWKIGLMMSVGAVEGLEAWKGHEEWDVIYF